MSVAVVTGSAVGIGAAIAEELGRRGVYVVTVDPGVNVDGTPGGDSGEATTAQRIVAAGGRARASNISVTDADALTALFAELVDEFGALDAVVNVAGISRSTSFAGGEEADWHAVLSVHVGGYLNVLRAALPAMVAVGHGRILGVTSGSGWRPADAGAYSCAKRTVAALTWRIGQETPVGVGVNALSPIAATRMVTGALTRQRGAGNTSGRDSSTGGVSLAALPPPEHLGPIGAYLAGEAFAAWSRGQIMFSNGGEVAWVAPPRLLEIAAHRLRWVVAAGARGVRCQGAGRGGGHTSEQRRWWQSASGRRLRQRGTRGRRHERCKTRNRRQRRPRVGREDRRRPRRARGRARHR